MTTNPLNDFVTKAEAYLKTVEAEFVEVADKFLPAIENVFEVALEDLAEIAVGAVLKQAPLVLDGTEKFGNAVASVVQTVEASGKTVAIQTAQTAVQTAYLTVQSVVKGN